MIIVRSPRGGAVQIGRFLPCTVREIAHDAAVDLGYHSDGVYTLATLDEVGKVLRYDDPAPEDGEYQLVDAGGSV